MTTNKRDGSAAAGAADASDTKADAAPAADTAAAELAEMRERFANMERAFAELKAKSDAEAAVEAQQGEPAPITHGLVLACGDMAEAPNPHASHHFCEVHGITVPVRSVFDLV